MKKRMNESIATEEFTKKVWEMPSQLFVLHCDFYRSELQIPRLLILQGIWFKKHPIVL